MKIKLNPTKNTISLKGLTVMQYQLIVALMSHVELGANTEVADAAYEFISDNDSQSAPFDCFPFFPTVSITAANSDSDADTMVLLQSPVLVAAAEDFIDHADYSSF